MANVYDFDGTILEGDTVLWFYKFISKTPKVYGVTKDIVNQLLSYDEMTFYDCVAHYYWIFKSLNNFDELVEEFWDEHIKYIKPFYYEIRKDDDVISSASPMLLVEPIMKRLGIKNYVATEVDSNWFLFNYNKGVNKIKNLFNKYPSLIINNFYSDSDNDLPLAKLAKKAYKVIGNEILDWDFNKNNLIPDESKYCAFLEMKGDSFKVLNLTDIQVFDKEIYELDTFAHTKRIIAELIDKTHPDLITLTGDQTYNGNEYCIKEICKFLDSFNIPFAPVLGNHDNLEEVIRNLYPARTQIKIYSQFKNCLMKEGPRQLAYYQNGYECFGNYIIKILKDGNPIRNLIMINSGDRYNFTKEELESSKHANDNNYAKLSDEQVEFIKKYSDIPSSLFLHIPPFIYAKAINESIDIGVDIFDDWKEFIKTANTYDELPWKNKNDINQGLLKDSCIACPPVNDMVYERLKDTKLDSMIAGHDHSNDFIVDYNGMILAYGVKTSKGCYFNKDILGGTLIEYKQNKKPTFKQIIIK